jgi:hypothetical protein
MLGPGKMKHLAPGGSTTIKTSCLFDSRLPARQQQQMTYREWEGRERENDHGGGTEMTMSKRTPTAVGMV